MSKIGKRFKAAIDKEYPNAESYEQHWYERKWYRFGAIGQREAAIEAMQKWYARRAGQNGVGLAEFAKDMAEIYDIITNC